MPERGEVKALHGIAVCVCARDVCLKVLEGGREFDLGYRKFRLCIVLGFLSLFPRFWCAQGWSLDLEFMIGGLVLNRMPRNANGDVY